MGKEKKNKFDEWKFEFTLHKLKKQKPIVIRMDKIVDSRVTTLRAEKWDANIFQKDVGSHRYESKWFSVLKQIGLQNLVRTNDNRSYVA